MFKNYLKIALRNIKKNKFYSFINIFGLSVGLACSIIIIFYVINELTYDSYHNDADRIYRVISKRVSPRGTYRMASTPGPLATSLKNDLPGVEETVRFVPPYENAENVLVVKENQRFFEKRIFFTDPQVFDVFTIPFLHGSRFNALTEPNSVVITESMASKYFDTRNPVGEIFSMEFDYDWEGPEVQLKDFTIVGVVKDAPVNTHIKYNMLVSMATLQKNLPNFENNWMNPKTKYNYVKFRKGTDVDMAEKKLQVYAEALMEKFNARYSFSIGEISYSLQPLTKIHMHSNLLRELEPGGNWLYIYIYSLIAGLVLLIGCMNFINLSTAVSTTRAREVGLRKIIGAKRSVIIWRFLVEAKIITLLSFCVALAVTFVLLPQFNRMAGTELTISNLLHPLVLIVLLVLFITVSISSGIFPALILTGLKSSSILQRKFTSGLKGSFLQKTLVVGQFTISIFLVICTLFIFKQLNYMKSGALGFDKEKKLILRVKSNLPHLRRDYEAIKADFQKNPHILGAAVSSIVPGDESLSGYSLWREGTDRDRNSKRLRVITVGTDFISLYNLQLVCGRGFSKDFESDRSGAFIVNETGARLLGFTNLEEALGKRFTAHYHGGTEEIIGVIKDFHFEGMQNEIEPLLLDIEGSLMTSITLKLNTDQLRETMGFIHDMWEQHFPEVPMEYSFLDDVFDRVYHYEEQMSNLLKIITSLGIIIACLGLSGLASFIAWKQQKEIGIRKVLGASVSNIVTNLSIRFVLLVLVSLFIASPLAWMAMQKWLENFAYKTSLNITIFIAASFATVAVASAAVIFQGIKAGRNNPIDALKNE